MTDDEITAFRATECVRMSPMREAMRKEAFVQGYLRGKFVDVGCTADVELLMALAHADAAYVVWRKTRTS